ncbi:MAG: DNA mismatch repair protein MutS [Deferribacteraceae bacterium]|jgi:DNA mismatch repair protein MutS|nr:DNA mismatch repair protein MutS [Deferribacteraceae bacterium]
MPKPHCAKDLPKSEKSAQDTPMMVQFNAIKERYPDTILFFRMGDFYEMFNDDACTASKILGIALTSRNKQSEKKIPMCGVPHHSHKQYLLKLIKAGYKVAICDQLEDPALASGIVKRGVTRIVSPGTMIDEDELSDTSNNFLLAVYSHNDSYFTAAADISTGELYLARADASGLPEIIGSFSPKEIICSAPVRLNHGNVVQRAAKSPAKAAAVVCENYKLLSPTHLGIQNEHFFVPMEMIFSYISDAMLQISFRRPALLAGPDILMLDQTAARTLEITESISDNGDTLFSALNYTSTAMGARLLRWWLTHPSGRIDVITARQNIIEFFVTEWRLTQELKKLLTPLYDIERIASRAASRRVSPKELICLRDSLKELPRIADILESAENKDITDICASLHNCEPIANLIEQSIADEPSAALKEGGIIREGYNKTADELRHIKNNGRQMIAALEAKLKSSTGINQLRISYNKVFGYYIEVSKSNLGKIPDYFERQQTLVNAERFVTPELKNMESAILSAEERINVLEYELYCHIRDMIAENADMLRDTAKDTALIDVYISLAHAAVIRGYVRPVIDDSGEIEVADARHPVVEAKGNDIFIPNDIKLNTSDSRLSIITGPNMSGKSTYIRSVALVVLMAHTGSFVPAAAARIGIVDRIFTRVGASDNISRGESTFMVEMVETANILAHATPKSLIILDEIGRGTSTFDGVSIAWAVSEHILNAVKAKTLFATHYHELTEIASRDCGAKNYTISVEEKNEEIIFMRKIIPGTADKSYGIYVAQLAGLPETVTSRAKEVLENLEEPVSGGNTNKNSPHHNKTKEIVVKQILIFDEDHPAITRLKNLDISGVTPIDAIKIISELKESVNE